MNYTRNPAQDPEENVDAEVFTKRCQVDLMMSSARGSTHLLRGHVLRRRSEKEVRYSWKRLTEKNRQRWEEAYSRIALFQVNSYSREGLYSHGDEVEDDVGGWRDIIRPSRISTVSNLGLRDGGSSV